MPEISDIHYMMRALELAEKGLGRVAPNPSVGCVIVKDGVVLGEGRTQDGGRRHAEAVALEQAGDNAKGATAYVTLEPCCHDDRPSCSSRLIDAGIARVVIGCIDQNPAINGKGIATLKQAGVEVVAGCTEKECADLNRGFFLTKTAGRPFITLKMAVSADNKITGPERWITGEESRADVHRLRSRHDAILTGVGTVLSDDPQLTTRIPGHAHAARKVILDTTFRMYEKAQILAACGAGEALVFTAPEHAGKMMPGARVIPSELDADSRVSIPFVLKTLAAEGITRLMVEAGQGVFTSFLRSGLWDELYLYRSPDVVGEDGLPATVDLSLMPQDGLSGSVQRGRDIHEIYKRVDRSF